MQCSNVGSPPEVYPPQHKNYSAVTQEIWQTARRHEPDLQMPHIPVRLNIHGMRQQNKQNGLQQLQI